MTNEYNPDGKEIRFIDSHYKDLFHIPDGSCVQIHYPDETVVKPVSYTHLPTRNESMRFCIWWTCRMSRKNKFVITRWV